MPQRLTLREQGGYTLVELMVAVVIVGTLAAIAVLQYADYRTRSLNSSALSDISHMTLAQETFFLDRQQYAPTLDHGGSDVELTAVKTAGDLLEGPAGEDRVIAQFVNGGHHELPILLGSSVVIQAHVDPVAAAYSAVSKHVQGDVMYGRGSHTTAIYRDEHSLGQGQGGDGGTPITDYIPTPEPRQDVFVQDGSPGQWVAQ